MCFKISFLVIQDGSEEPFLGVHWLPAIITVSQQSNNRNRYYPSSKIITAVIISAIGGLSNYLGGSQSPPWVNSLPSGVGFMPRGDGQRGAGCNVGLLFIISDGCPYDSRGSSGTVVT